MKYYSKQKSALFTFLIVLLLLSLMFASCGTLSKSNQPYGRNNGCSGWTSFNSKKQFK